MLRIILAAAMVFAGAGARAQAPSDPPRGGPAYARVYVIAVCAASEEISDECLSQGLRLAAYALSEMYLRAYRGQTNWNSLRVRFPYGWVEASQERFLRDVETQGIARAKEKIESEYAPIDRALMLGEAVKAEAWLMQATFEASDGRNWSHDWAQYRHDFAASHPMRQLLRANLFQNAR
jgi:hypothetical protein